MSDEAFGLSIDTSTPIKTSDQLNDILEIERLVHQSLKDNYDLLKEKYNSLQKDYTSLRIESCKLKELNKNEENARQEENHRLIVEFRSKLTEIQQKHDELRANLEQFKKTAKKELISICQTQLNRMLIQVEQTKSSNLKLLTERAELLGKVEEIKRDFEHSRSMNEAKYADLKQKTDLERCQLLDKLNEMPDVSQIEKQAAEVVILQQRSNVLEQNFKEQCQLISKMNQENAMLEHEMHQFRREKAAFQTKIYRLESEIDESKNILADKSKELEEIRGQLFAVQKSKFNAEVECERKLMAKEKQLELKINAFEMKSMQFEAMTEAKIAEIQATNAAIICEHEASNKVMISNAQSDYEEKISKMEMALKQQNNNNNQQSIATSVNNDVIHKLELELADEKHHNTLNLRQLEWDRDNLEVQIAKMRCKLKIAEKNGFNVDVFSANEKQLERMKNALLAGEKKRNDLQLHYRDLLKRMKKSFQTVELNLEKFQFDLQKRNENDRWSLFPQAYLPEMAIVGREIETFQREHRQFSASLRQEERRFLRVISHDNKDPPKSLA